MLRLSVPLSLGASASKLLGFVHTLNGFRPLYNKKAERCGDGKNTVRVREEDCIKISRARTGSEAQSMQKGHSGVVAFEVSVSTLLRSV